MIEHSRMFRNMMISEGSITFEKVQELKKKKKNNFGKHDQKKF